MRSNRDQLDGAAVQNHHRLVGVGRTAWRDASVRCEVASQIANRNRPITPGDEWPRAYSGPRVTRPDACGLEELSSHARNSAGVNWNSATTSNGPRAIALIGFIRAHWLVWVAVAKTEGDGVGAASVAGGEGVGGIDEVDPDNVPEGTTGSDAPGAAVEQAAMTSTTAAISNRPKVNLIRSASSTRPGSASADRGSQSPRIRAPHLSARCRRVTANCARVLRSLGSRFGLRRLAAPSARARTAPGPPQPPAADRASDVGRTPVR